VADDKPLFHLQTCFDEGQAALLDSCYCIESDVSAEQLSTQDVHDRYKDLQDVERNFRRLKTAFLEVLPIFVRKQQRTRGHVFVAMSALKLLRLMEQRLGAVFGTTDTNPEAETADSVLVALSRSCLENYTIGVFHALNFEQACGLLRSCSTRTDDVQCLGPSRVPAQSQLHVSGAQFIEWEGRRPACMTIGKFRRRANVDYRYGSAFLNLLAQFDWPNSVCCLFHRCPRLFQFRLAPEDRVVSTS